MTQLLPRYPGLVAVDLDETPEEPGFRPRYNIAPTQYLLAILLEDGQRRAARLRWGMNPFWAKDPADIRGTFNARAETVATKASFRGPFRRRRCLVPVDAFYEWPKRGTRREKEPYVIRRADEAPLVLAGLWDVWRRGEEVIVSCAIITTEANALMRTIPHDRMPVILEPPEFDAWLDPFTPLQQVQAMLAPPPDGILTMWRVSTRVNTGAHDDPQCWEPLEMGSAD